MLERISRNILWLGLSRIISGIILFVVYTRLVAYLGPHEFGKYALVLAYYTFFLLIMDLGVSKFVTKKVSEDRGQAGVYLGNYLVLQFFVSLIVLGLLVIIPRLLGYEADVTRAMLLVGMGLLIGSLSTPFLSIVHAWQRLDIAAMINFALTLVNGVWLVLAILLRKDVVFIFWVYILIGIIYIFAYLVAARKMALPKFALQKDIIKEMFVFGPPFVMISGFEIMIQKIDSVIQKFFLPFSDLGQYSAAYRFLDFLTFIPAIVALSLFPFLAETRDLKRQDLPPVLNRLNRYLISLAVSLGVGGTLFAGKIITALFGEQYLEAVLPLQILIWASALTFIYAVPNVIMLVKRTKQMVAVLGLTTIFNILANWLLIPRGGIVASAWITVVSYVIVTLSYIYLARKESEFELFRYLGWPIVAAGVMGSLAWVIRGLNIFALVAVCAAVYYGILFAVKFLRREDWDFFLSVFKRQPL